MRKLFLLVAVLTLTVPALAQDQDSRPHFKLSGHLMGTTMMDTNFNPADYTYEHGRGSSLWQNPISNATLFINEPGWGVSAQWSADEKFWVELGWQHAPALTATIDTSISSSLYLVPCGTNWGTGAYCPFSIGDEQTNRQKISAEDFTVALKRDLTPDSRYVSVLLGAGAHRRYIRDRSAVVTTHVQEWFASASGNLFQKKNDEPSTFRRTDSSSRTRLFLQADAEFYPAGKSKFIGLGVTARVLSDGTREQQYFTDTLTDKHILIGVEPGWYDVTARLILRF
jgi:hypothetical protein